MGCAGCLNLSRSEASRRAFLQVGSLGFLGMNLTQYLRAATAQKAGKAQACILLWLEGGPSQRRHMGSETYFCIQSHLDQRRRNPGFRTVAAGSQDGWTGSRSSAPCTPKATTIRREHTTPSPAMK